MIVGLGFRVVGLSGDLRVSLLVLFNREFVA